MSQDKVKQFHFVQLGNNGRRLFCIQQNLGTFIWIIFCQSDSIQPVVKISENLGFLQYAKSWIWSRFKEFRKKLLFLIKFSKCKYQWHGLQEVVHLPIYGQFCVSIHKGYKVFDLRKNIVAKVYNLDVDGKEVADEVERLKCISQIGVAPSIKRWNIEEKWYEEEYINGSSDDCTYRDSTNILEKFYQDICPCIINQLILFQPSRICHAQDYLSQLMQGYQKTISSVFQTSPQKFETIESFSNGLLQPFTLLEQLPIYLVFTHGDFVPANMLNTKKGLKIVDWEDATWRTPLYDFYSYFFLRLVSWNHSVQEVQAEIKLALSFFIAELSRKEPEISASIDNLETLYRRTYYLELLCRLAKRHLTDKNLDIMHYMLRYAEEFSKYEKSLS